MKKMLKIVLAAGMLTFAAGGCATITSSGPSVTNATGEAWYTEAIGFMGLTWGSRIWYCPAATAPGPATCKEAKLVELTKEELDAQKAAEKAAHP